MKRKIPPILVCILLILPAFAIARNVNNQTPIITTNYTESVPTWSVEDSWTYDVIFSGGILDVLGFDIAISNLKITVVSVTGSTYNMNVEGDATGEISIIKLQIIKGRIQDTTISGDAVYSASNIGIKELNVQINGEFQLIPGKFVIDMILWFDPPYNPIQWPVDVGKQWNIPVSNVEGKLDLTYGGDKIFDDMAIPNILGGQPVKCTGFEPVTVAAGTYDAYKIVGVYEDIEMCYAPDAGNLIDITTNSDEYNLNMVLKFTTYSGGVKPGAPNKPSRPSGPTTISPGQQYTYSSSTTDNEGDQIYYLFSWGDNSDSGWIGPYNSGAAAEASHSWSNTGSYSIKVKAKDTGDLESQWSDPLSVSTSKFKIINNFKMLQLLRNRFTFYLNNFL